MSSKRTTGKFQSKYKYKNMILLAIVNAVAAQSNTQIINTNIDLPQENSDRNSFADFFQDEPIHESTDLIQESGNYLQHFEGVKNGMKRFLKAIPCKFHEAHQ